MRTVSACVSGKPSEPLRINETCRDSSQVPITHKTKTALQLHAVACDTVRHFTRIQPVLLHVPTYNSTACVVLGTDVDSAQTALAKLNLHVPLSCLHSSSKTGNSTNFSFIAFSETTFYSYSDFRNNLIPPPLSSAKIEDCDVIGRAFGGLSGINLNYSPIAKMAHKVGQLLSYCLHETGRMQFNFECITFLEAHKRYFPRNIF